MIRYSKTFLIGVAIAGTMVNLLLWQKVVCVHSPDNWVCDIVSYL